MFGKVYNVKEFEKLLTRNGWIYDHQTGDHRIWIKEGRHISVPYCKLNPTIARRLIKENKLKEVY